MVVSAKSLFLIERIIIHMKIAVLGAGYLGKIHLRLIKDIPEYNLVGFYDIDTSTAKKVSQEFKVNSFDSFDNLITSTDVVVVATPTLSHFECAKKAIENKKHVFIEKPVTHSVEEANELLALVEKMNVKVQVGHVERFNPAFTSAIPFIKNPLFIEVHRLSSFNTRGTDVSVVLDLMIHDIDIVLSIVKSKVTQISTSGVAVASKNPDITNARIEFENGCVANLTASRVSLKKMRKSRIFQKDAYISIDFLNEKTEIISLSDSNSWNPFATNIEIDSSGNKKSIHFKQPKIVKRNAIQEELRTFALSIIDNKTTIITLAQGCEALKIAHTIMHKINERITSSF